MLGDLRAALRQFVVDRCARRTNGFGDFPAPEGQFCGQFGCRAQERFGDLIAGIRNVTGHLCADPAQGFADPFGVVRKRVALICQSIDQTLDAQFVLAVGTLKCGDFIVNQRFQLAGASQCARNRIIHGGDLAANGLTERCHRLRGQLVGFGQAHRDFRHRRRHQAQFMRTPDQQRQKPEQGHGYEYGRHQCQGCWIAQYIAARQRGKTLIEQQQSGGQAHKQPNNRRRERQIERRARRALLKRENQPADRRKIVIRGNPAARGLCGPPWGFIRCGERRFTGPMHIRIRFGWRYAVSKPLRQFLVAPGAGVFL